MKVWEGDEDNTDSRDLFRDNQIYLLGKSIDGYLTKDATGTRNKRPVRNYSRKPIQWVTDYLRRKNAGTDGGNA
jgi:hypothetical protein